MSGDCVVSHGVRKDGTPKTVRASHGLLCKGHASRLHCWLREIAVDFALLDTLLQPAQGNGERRSSGDESVAPLNLAVAALRDSERVREPRERGDELWYELPDIPAVLPTLRTRAEDIRCLLDPSHDHDPEVWNCTLTGEVNYLLTTFDTLIEADFIDDAFNDIKQCWIALQRVHDRPRPKPLGRCLSFDCDGTVWPRAENPPWCSTCKRLYETAADLAKLAIEEDKRRKKTA